MYLYYYLFSIPLMLISNLMIMFSKSFFFMWMIMEINLISFISILMMNKFIYSEEIMKYYIIQSFNSHMFFMSNLMLNFNFMQKFFSMIVIVSLLSKMGMPPFHTWYIKMMKYLNWMIFFMNSSIQKFIPLMILNYTLFINKMLKIMIFFILFFSSIIPLFSMKTLSLKLMMSFSSMIQISWIMIFMFINEFTWLNYFLIYTLISASIYYMFYKFNINYIYNFNNNFNNKSILYFLSMEILSLAGLPPFTGFINKWMFISYTFNFMSIYLNSILLILSLLNLFYYIRSMMQILMFSNIKINYNLKFITFKNLKNLKINLMMIFSLMSLFIYEMI